MKPYIGQKVVLNTLLRHGDFPGTVVIVDSVDGLCTVQLECQKEPVGAVVYYDERPEEVWSVYWQVCFPVEEVLC